MRSGSSAATSGSLLVRRNTRMPLRARSAASPSPAIWAMNAGRVPTRPGLVKSRIAHRSPRPFSIGRAGERQPGAGREPAQLLGRLAGRVLDGLGLVEHEAGPRSLGQRVDVAHGGAVGGDDDVGVGHLATRARRPTPGTAPWWTTTRSSGVKRAASAAQLPTTAGGAMTSAGPLPVVRARWASTVGRLAEAHVEGQAAAELGGVEEAEPGQRLGLVAAQLADEALGRGRPAPSGAVLACSNRSVAQPLPADDDAAGRSGDPPGRGRGAGSRRR